MSFPCLFPQARLGQSLMEGGPDQQGRDWRAELVVFITETDRAFDLLSGFLPEIAARYEQLRADAERTVDVTVTSAVELTAAQQQHYTQAMKQRLDREVRLHCAIDPTLLGGAIVRADDLVIDGSVRAGLAQLAGAMEG